MPLSLVPVAVDSSPFMVLVMLLYGLAFLALGWSIALRNDVGSSLRIAPALWFLASFGLVHGVVEWLGLWRLLYPATAWLHWMQPLLLLLSFLLLFEFGRRLMRAAIRVAQRPAWVRAALHPGMHGLLVLAPLLAFALCERSWLALGVVTRYLPGTLSALLSGAACWAFWQHRVGADASTTDYPSVRLSWLAASVAFVLYGVFSGLVVPRVDGFWGNSLNVESFANTLHIPVQLLRAGCAVVLTLSVAHLLRIFELETQRQLGHSKETAQYALRQLYALQARFEALLEAGSEAAVGLDASGATVFVNQRALRLLGHERAELIGQSFHRLVQHSPAQGQVLREQDCRILQTLADGQPRQADNEWFWRRNGTWFPVSYRAVPVGQARPAEGVLILFHSLV